MHIYNLQHYVTCYSSAALTIVDCRSCKLQSMILDAGYDATGYGYGFVNSEAPTPSGGQTQAAAQGNCRSQKPGGRNGPSEAPRRPMVGPGRCLAGPKGARPLPTDPMGPLGPCRAHRPAPVAGRALTGARIGRFALWGHGRHPARSAMYAYHATGPGA